MKNLIVTILFSIVLLNTFTSKANSNLITNSNDTTALYKYLGESIKYPNKARIEDVQGNNLILFSVADGKVKDIIITTQLGANTDGEVLNSLLSFTDFKGITNGKYALKTTFKLEGSSSLINNENILIPKGYTPLKLTIVAFKEANAALIELGEQQTPNNRNLIIRGINNMDASKSPLYILDGRKIEYGELKQLDAQKIESVSILKDTKSVGLYGKEAINGVVIITTKSLDLRKTDIKQ